MLRKGRGGIVSLIIMSVDPGIKNIGVAVLDATRPKEPLLLHTLAPGALPYFTLRSFLINTIVRFRPVFLVVEAAIRASRFASAHVEAVGIVRGVAEEFGVELASYTPAGWKKLAFSQGRLKKHEVLRKTKALGYSPVTAHEGDALGLMLAFLRGNGLEKDQAVPQEPKEPGETAVSPNPEESAPSR